VSAKLTLDPSIDIEYIAAETEGLSGADLQAVVYNAHLEVVQASIADINEEETSSVGKGKGKGKGKEADGKSKGRDSSHGGEDKPKVEKKRKTWMQVAPEGAEEIHGLAARVSRSAAAALWELTPYSWTHYWPVRAQVKQARRRISSPSR